MVIFSVCVLFDFVLLRYDGLISRCWLSLVLLTGLVVLWCYNVQNAFVCMVGFMILYGGVMMVSWWFSKWNYIGAFRPFFLILQ